MRDPGIQSGCREIEGNNWLKTKGDRNFEEQITGGRKHNEFKRINN